MGSQAFLLSNSLKRSRKRGASLEIQVHYTSLSFHNQLIELFGTYNIYILQNKAKSSW